MTSTPSRSFERRLTPNAIEHGLTQSLGTYVWTQARVMARSVIGAWRRRSSERAILGTWRAQGGTTGPKTHHAASPVLSVAAVLFNKLDHAGVRYGVLQDVSTLHNALAGEDDLDILVHRQDHATFCSILAGLYGLRGTSLACYDNVCAGREDWFVPDFPSARYLHLDVHVGMRVGWEFRKRYPALDYAAVAKWERITLEGACLPVASVEDEIRIAIARFAFRLWAPPWRRWISLPGDWNRSLTGTPLAPAQQRIPVTWWGLEGETQSWCRIWRNGTCLSVRRADLVALRRALRGNTGFTNAAGTDSVVHQVRKASYLTLRVLHRLLPGTVPVKRRPSNGGLVVAIVGPDGLGKSTQVDRLARTFAWKFACVQFYLGTGDGTGWWLRKGMKKVLFPHRSLAKAVLRPPAGMPRSQTWKSHAVAAGLVFWGSLIAIERYGAAKRAHRAATRGNIVICDRWPQALQRGFLDGPIIPPPPFIVPGLAMLARLEQRLYKKMHEMRPDLTLHLVSDYTVSQSRKPGDISRDAFDARLSLMQELRNLDERIQIIDASPTTTDVNRDLFKRIWLSL